MSFFSHVKYDKSLPDGKRVELITNDLVFGNLFYEISETGRLLLNNENGSFTDVNYTGRLFVYTYGGEFQGYFMDFDKNGTLQKVTQA